MLGIPLIIGKFHWFPLKVLLSSASISQQEARGLVVRASGSGRATCTQHGQQSRVTREGKSLPILRVGCLMNQHDRPSYVDFRHSGHIRGNSIIIMKSSPPQTKKKRRCLHLLATNGQVRLHSRQYTVILSGMTPSWKWAKKGARFHLLRFRVASTLKVSQLIILIISQNLLSENWADFFLQVLKVA